MTKLCKSLYLTAAAAACLSLGFVAAPLSAKGFEIEFDANNFTDAANLTNSFLSYDVGDTFTYLAETPDGCVWSIVTVAGTEIIDVDADTSIEVREIQDLEYEDEDCDGPDGDELVEQTSDWFGQDSSGNVWYFGEDTRDCDGVGDCDATPSEGSWRAFVDDAEPGIIMLASPTSGTSYQQELAEGVAEDSGMVMNFDSSVTLSNGDEFEDCVVTKEWNALDPGHIEQKTYCEGVGLVLVKEHHGKLVQVELQPAE